MSPIEAITIGEVLEHVAPGQTWRALACWPPDVFAVTGTILADTGVYRCVICPPEGESWPPSDAMPGNPPWEESVRSDGTEWAVCVAAAAETCADAETMAPELPESVLLNCSILDGADRVALDSLDDKDSWQVASAILTLHAMADEACVGAGRQTDSWLQQVALSALEETGSMSNLPADRVRVLPKLRPPDSGITVRSISHHLSLDRSEVHTNWLRPESVQGVRDDSERSKLTMLLIPYPSTVHASDFRSVARPLLNMDQSRFGFYEYAPAESLDLSMVVELVETARSLAGSIDMVVLPESALDESETPQLQRVLSDAGIPCLIAGVHRPADQAGAFGANYAYIGGEGWQAVQHKHHRWCLDPSQIHQYHLGAALDPNQRWWEAIGIGRRSLNFVTIPDSTDLTICPLVCEDLARPDPVTYVIRAVAPTLVVALLFDGPQLASRWPARYASVLADDPGCAVLTLTALGMAWRSQPAGFDPSRVIALWKDPHRGLQQITLAEGARAIALTAHRRDVEVTSADGRTSANPVAELVLSGIEQIP